MKKYSNLIIVIICFLVITTITIGYSAMNATLDINISAKISPNAVARVGNKYYASIQDAINSIKNTNQTAVYLVKDVNETVVIPDDRNIILNTDGYTLSSNEVTITNYGTLKVLSSEILSNGTSINIEDNYAIHNFGNLQVIDSNIEANKGGSNYSSKGIKSEGIVEVYIEESTVYGSTTGIESGDSSIEIGKQGNLNDSTVITGGEYAVDVGTNDFIINSGKLVGTREPGYSGNTIPPTGYYVYTSLINGEYVSTVKAEPNVTLKVTKKETATTVNSGVWSNIGLDFLFTVSNDDTNTAKIYYCKDATNTCEPNIEVTSDTLVTDYEDTNGTYYIRYKLVYGDNISTTVQSYQAKVDQIVPNTSDVTGTVTYGTDTATLKFDITGSDETTGVTKYILYYKTASDSSYTTTTITTTDSTATKSITASQGTTYSYYVETYDGVNNKSTSGVNTVAIKTYGQSEANCGSEFGTYSISSTETKLASCTPVDQTDTGTTYTTCTLDSSWTTVGTSNVSSCTASETTTKKITCSGTKYSCGSWSSSTATKQSSCTKGSAPACGSASQSYVYSCTLTGYAYSCSNGGGSGVCTGSNCCVSRCGTSSSFTCRAQYTKVTYSRTKSTYKTKTEYAKYYTRNVYTRTKTANSCWY